MTSFTPHQDSALKAVADWLKAKPGTTPEARILRDIVVIWIATFCGGCIIGVAAATQSLSSSTFTIGIAVSNLLISTALLTASACLAPRGNRWAHIGYVALGLWLTSIVNTLMGVSLVMWLFGCIPIAICAAIGGGLSYVFKRDPESYARG